MPTFGPIKRQVLIRNLRKLGFEGPLPGGNHQYLVKGLLKVWIPNPHQGDISQSLLARILSQANISRDDWESL
jgi:predicted RNA binding protein YcfA (HicA-like mRNA interferase family)